MFLLLNYEILCSVTHKFIFLNGTVEHLTQWTEARIQQGEFNPDLVARLEMGDNKLPNSVPVCKASS